MLNSLNQLILSFKLLESFAMFVLFCLQLLLGLKASCLQRQVDMSDTSPCHITCYMLRGSNEEYLECLQRF